MYHCEIKECGRGFFFPHYWVFILDTGRRVVTCKDCAAKIHKLMKDKQLRGGHARQAS